PGVALSAAAGPFLRSGVDVLKSAGRVTDGRDIAIVPADELLSLPALVIAPSDPVRIGAANRALERAGVPWRFGAGGPRREESTVVAASAFTESTRTLAATGGGGGGGGADSARGNPFTDVSATLRYELVAQA